MTDTARVLREFAQSYRSQAELFSTAPPESPGAVQASTLMEVAHELEQASYEAERGEL